MSENNAFFDEVLIFRLTNDDRRKIMRVLKKNKKTFSSYSNFCRSALIRLLRQYDKSGKRIVRDLT